MGKAPLSGDRNLSSSVDKVARRIQRLALEIEGIQGGFVKIEKRAISLSETRNKIKTIYKNLFVDISDCVICSLSAICFRNLERAIMSLHLLINNAP